MKSVFSILHFYYLLDVSWLCEDETYEIDIFVGQKQSASRNFIYLHVQVYTDSCVLCIWRYLCCQLHKTNKWSSELPNRILLDFQAILKSGITEIKRCSKNPFWGFYNKRMFPRQTCFWDIVPTVTFSKQHLHHERIRDSILVNFFCVKISRNVLPKADILSCFYTSLLTAKPLLLAGWCPSEGFVGR